MLKQVSFIILVLLSGSDLYAASTYPIPTLSSVKDTEQHAPIVTSPVTTSPSQQKQQTSARRNSLTGSPVKVFMGSHSPTTKYVMISQRRPSSRVSPKKGSATSPQTFPQVQKVSPTVSASPTGLARISPPPSLAPSPTTAAQMAQQTSPMSPQQQGTTPVKQVSPLRLNNSCKSQSAAETVIRIAAAANADVKQSEAVTSLLAANEKEKEEHDGAIATSDTDAQKWVDDLIAMSDSMHQNTSATEIAKMRMAQLA